MKPGCRTQAKLLRTNKRHSLIKRQEGLALLVLVVTIALTLSAYYFSTISVTEIKIENHETTRAVLKQAKQALINYAVTHAYGNGNGTPGEYGYLPCPDSSPGGPGSEGNQDANCGARFKNNLGYLPWGTLNIPVLKDSSGSCLWYAVSGNYKSEISSELVNEDTEGAFRIVDEAENNLQTNVIAVVFAPGAAISGQTRVYTANTQCGEDYGNQAAYLEGDGTTNNANLVDGDNEPDPFIQATLTSPNVSPLDPVPYNDNLITITREEIWQAFADRTEMNNRLAELTEALAVCMTNYMNHPDNVNLKLPWPAALDLETGDYRIQDDYSDDSDASFGYAGRFPLHIDDTESVLSTTVNDRYLDPLLPGDPGDICSAVNTSAGIIDLTDTAGVHRNLLRNWKDHFFFAVSKDFALPNTAVSSCSANCVSVAGINYAAIVFFGGSPLSNVPQFRSPAGVKSNVLYYLENGNAARFPDSDGNNVYQNGDPNSNDIMFCIQVDGSAPVNCS